ncbi:MAG: glutamate 5-kinase [Dysgonamonadaceae bacterium]|jgi:glutamate 5-kinase|nr:glutamate 5-kinase [Dysgonamonadaceae bacterium]
MYGIKRLAIKIGSNVLTRADGTLDVTRMSSLVDQIAFLHRNGLEIILISSGAVASGRNEIKVKGRLDDVSARQLYAAVGQAKLMNRYYDFFKAHGIACGQVLTTKESLGTRRHYLNQKNCVNVMLENKVIPIMNENDTIAVTELMFTDNDELSGMIAAMMDAEMLILLSNVDGIYNGSPGDSTAEIIREIDLSNDITACIQTGKSTFGRGGMLTKYRIARKVAGEGIEVIIANGKTEAVLPRLLEKNQDVLCSRFIPSPKVSSGIKKWIAHSESFAKGEIHINADAAKVLSDEKATSLLPVGIVAVKGVFEKDDIVRIYDDKLRQIGLGKVSYDSVKARELIGKKGNKPVIHYDYLCLDLRQ